MIGHLKGILIEKQAPQLILEVNGIGYEIDAPMSTFYQLPEVGLELKLFTHLIVREDAHHLYGFYSRDERSLFRTLLKVNGVGPKLALTILSSVAPSEFVHAVLNNDTAGLVKLPGVGKKTADRLVIEMRDRLSDWCPQLPSSSQHSASFVLKNERHPILQDAISALITLGYKQQEASKTIAKVDDGTKSSEELIRLALREVSL